MDLDKFLDLEKKHNLYDDKILGVDYWIYVRKTVWEEYIVRAAIGTGVAHGNKRRTTVEKIICLTNLFGNLLIADRKVKKNVDLCIMNHERRIKEGENYNCMYTEEIAERFPENVVLERPYQFGHLRPVRTKNLIYTDYIAIKGNLYYELHMHIRSEKYKKIIKQSQEKLRLFFDEIEATYEICINRKGVYEYIAKRILIYEEKKKLYEKLITKINPKVILEVVSYNMDCMIVNEISYEKGIMTIELQHGSHSKHCAYNYFTHNTISQLPKKIFLFSEYWKAFTKVPIEPSDLVAVGFPYYDKMKKKYYKCRQKNKIGILFISQGPIGEFLSRMAADLIQYLDMEKYSVTYKLHPGEFDDWKHRYPWLIDTGIRVVDNMEHNLYEYFSEADYEVGVFSTALFEGLGFGLTAFIYNIDGVDAMKVLCDEGYAILVDSAKQFADLISKNQETLRTQADNFWKKNSLDNICKEIRYELERT